MGFSDDQLELLKASLDTFLFQPVQPKQLEALIYRLECAEAFITDTWDADKYQKLLKAWLRSKSEGEEGT